MGKSYRKTPIMGLCSDSDKKDKRRANRMFRHKEHIALRVDKDPPFNKNQTITVWDMSKDGKTYFGHLYYEDKKLYNKFMRK